LAETPQGKIARRFRAQAIGCAALGSPLYGSLFERAAGDIEAGGPVWHVVEPYAADPGGSALALRLAGAVHRLALTGQAPGVAAHFPSTGGDGDAVAAWVAWHALIRERPEEVRPLVARGVQTNEVGRVGALLGGFLDVARRTALPLRILEVGSSAGLNLRWDHFRVATWGPADARVDLGDPFEGSTRPDLSPVAVTVVERRGCDVSPIDPTSDEGKLTLLSFVWPDQTDRFANLAAACELAAAVPARVDRVSGDEWLAELLSSPEPGTVTVVFHSVMRQYMTPAARAAMTATIEEAGRQATGAAPLAWLHLEPRDNLASEFVVRLTEWPAGPVERTLAVAHPHGTWVRWCG
jgi:hypothetical protein